MGFVKGFRRCVLYGFIDYRIALFTTIGIGLTIIPPLLWTYVPYRITPIERLFTENHTGAARITLDAKADVRLFTVFEKILYEMTENAPESISPSSLYEKMPDSVDLAPPFHGNCLISSKNTYDEIVIQTIYPECENKICQIYWELKTFLLDSMNITSIEDATVIDLQRPPSLDRPVHCGGTWFRGNYVLGHFGENLSGVIEDLQSETINEFNEPTYLTKNWPYKSTAPIVAVMENRNNCLPRLLKEFINDSDYYFDHLEEGFPEDSTTEYDPDNEVDDSNLEREVELFLKEVSPSLSKIEGLSIEGYYNNTGNIELPVAFSILPDTNVSQVKEDIDEIMEIISDASNGKLKIWERIFRDNRYVTTLEVSFRKT